MPIELTVEECKKYSLDELERMKIISNSDRGPSSNLTDKKWQKEFEIRKMFVLSSDKKSASKTHYYVNSKEYTSFINDIIKTLRKPNGVDYCFFIYQIMDLFKCYGEDLKTRYCDGYWQVWLESKIVE